MIFSLLKKSIEKITATPEKKQAFFREGAQKIQSGEWDDALNLYKKAAEIFPDEWNCHTSLGFVLMEMGKHQEAFKVLSKATKLAPHEAEPHYLLGESFMGMGDLRNATPCYEQTLKIDNRFEFAYVRLSKILYAIGDLKKSQAIAEQGISLFPNNCRLLACLGNTYTAIGQRLQALDAYKRAYQLEPEDPVNIANYAECLRSVGELEKSIALHQKAVELDPLNPDFFSNYLYALMFSSDKEAKFLLAEHLRYAERFEKPLEKFRYLHHPRTLVGRRLRIGYVSGDFRNHSLAPFFEPVLRTHDRNIVEVYCYYTHPIEDEITARIRMLADHWVPCALLTDEAMAQRIYEDQIDVLIDLSGHTGYNRLLVFARKPAPIQMTWLGYQSTTGLSAIDYRITDRGLDPLDSDQEKYTEKLLYVTSSGIFQPCVDLPQIKPKAPHSKFYFGCLNNPSKITPEALDVWSEILKECTNSVLLIGNSSDAIQERITNYLALKGVRGNQLDFRPRTHLRQYLELHNQIDVMLDTFPYNGGTTNFYALHMGVPIIGLKGEKAVANVGYGLMKCIANGWSAENKEDYKLIAIKAYRGELGFSKENIRTTTERMLKEQSQRLCKELESALHSLINKINTAEE